MTLIKNFLRSLRHAAAGIAYTFRAERNFQIEHVLGTLVLFLAYFFPLTLLERSVIFLAIGLVLTLELVNTAFERLLDLLKPRVHPYVKVVKDVVAGSVLVGSVAAFVAGLYIFAPYVWFFLSSVLQ